jgi:hypothetical protein
MKATSASEGEDMAILLGFVLRRASRSMAGPNSHGRGGGKCGHFLDRIVGTIYNSGRCFCCRQAKVVMPYINGAARFAARIRMTLYRFATRQCYTRLTRQMKQITGSGFDMEV